MIRKQIPSIHDTFSLLCNKFNTSVKNKITLPKCPPWNWKIQLNTELIMYNKQETNPIIITSYFKEIIQNRYSNFLQIYTDGSKSTHGTGFPIIMEETKILHKLLPESSNFSAENYSILEAIKLINLTISNNCILLISDSLSALLALQNPFSSNEITQNIQTKLSLTQKKN